MDYQPYERACPNQGYSYLFEKGDQGRAWDFCTADDGQEMVYVYEDRGDGDSGWVEHGVLEHC
jgi:transposase